MALVIGACGTLVLISLGLWQLQRLAWKEEIIAQIEEMATSAPVLIPDAANEAEHEYLPVRASGVWQLGEAHVLTSVKGEGPGYRIIAPFRIADGRRILVDRGFVLETAKNARRPVGGAEISGHLVWPNEVDSFTPDPDLDANIWFARDVAQLAATLDTEPVMMVVARSSSLGGPRPIPANVALPNNHLSYAIQWFGMAAVWAAMTLLYIQKSRPSAASNDTP